jgi:hypothetical protein
MQDLQQIDGLPGFESFKRRKLAEAIEASPKQTLVLNRTEWWETFKALEYWASTLDMRPATHSESNDRATAESVVYLRTIANKISAHMDATTFD